MPPGQQRHSAVEYLVFGLAMALMLVLLYQGVQRGLPALLARGQDRPGISHYRAVEDSAAVEPAQAPDAVGFVAAVKVIPGGKGPKRIAAVPAPPRR